MPPFGAAAGSRADVVTLADMSSLDAEVDVTESSIQQIHVGQACEIIVDAVPELLAAARAVAPANVTFIEADATSLPLESFSFDLAVTRRTLHHIARPELVVAELVRVTRLGGTIVIEDQIAPVDPLAALEVDRFERARDPSHTRLLPDVDLRHLFEANGLVLETRRYRTEQRTLDSYLELAGCTGEERERAAALSPGGREGYVAESSWYVLRR